MAPAEIVTGPLPELEDAFVEAVERLRAPDPLAPVTVLVGHVLLKRYLPRMLARRGHAHINMRFVTMNELAATLAPDDVELEKPHLSPDAERLIVREIAAGATGYFGAIARGEGFVDALMRLFRELDLGGFDDGALEQVCIAAGFADHAKMDGLITLYAAYVKRRAAFATTADAYRRADTSSFAGRLLVYGVWSLTEVQATLLDALAQSHDATIFIPRTGGDADDAHLALRARLVQHGATARALTHRDDTPLAQIAGALFTTPGAPKIGATNVALVSAPDTVREIWEAARACLDWARQGIAFHEMAVVYRNRDPYRALVDEIFSEAGIETYLHDGRLLSAHPLGRRLLSLLDLAADPRFTRHDVMEFLTETRIPYETSQRYGRIRPSAWETFTREAGIVAGIEQWRTRLTRLAAEKRERAKDEKFSWMAGAADRVDELNAFIADFHRDLTSQRAGDARWDEHLAYLRGIATTYDDGLTPLLDALDDLKTLAAVAERVPFDVFCRAVRDYLERRDASDVLGEPIREFGKRGVAVMDASSLRHLRFRAVHLVGVAERAWPPPPRPDPLLLEHERRRLNDASAGCALPLRTEPDAEALTFVLAIEAATEHLALSYARAEAGGSGKHLPSYFFRAVAEALEGRSLDLAELDASGCVRRIEAGRLACDDPGASLSLAEYDRGLIRSHVADAAPAVVAAISVDTPSFGRAIVARQARWSRALTAFDGVMSSELAIERLAAQQFARGRAVSPSRLETYAECPYRYFLRYALGVEPIDEPEALERIDALERGSLIHAILERFLRECERDDPPSANARPRHLLRLLAVAHEEGRDREERGVTGRPLLWAMDQQQIHGDLIRWYDAEVTESARTDVRPGDFEVAFGAPAYGNNETTALTVADPLPIAAGDERLLVQGRIDRVDWDHAKTRFRVIDYKTGKSSMKTAFDHGRALQLPIYLLVAARALGIDATQGEAQYFYASSRGGFKRATLGGETLDDRRADLEQVLTTIVDGVDSGYFAPNPGNDAGNCMWCDYKDVCDKKIDRIAARKTEDARGAQFIAMQEIS